MAKVAKVAKSDCQAGWLRRRLLLRPFPRPRRRCSGHWRRHQKCRLRAFLPAPGRLPAPGCCLGSVSEGAGPAGRRGRPRRRTMHPVPRPELPPSSEEGRRTGTGLRSKEGRSGGTMKMLLNQRELSLPPTSSIAPGAKCRFSPTTRRSRTQPGRSRAVAILAPTAPVAAVRGARHVKPRMGPKSNHQFAALAARVDVVLWNDSWCEGGNDRRHSTCR